MAVVSDVLSDLDQWRDFVGSTVVPLEIDADREASFVGTIDASVVDDIALMRVVSVAQRVRRTPVGCRQAPSDMIKVLVQRSGRAGIEQQDRRTILPPRALTVYDTARPYGVIEHMDFVADVVLVPRERLPLGAEAVAALQERPMSIEQGPGALFASYLDDLRSRLGECSPESASRCTSILLELLGAALAEAPASSISGAALRLSVLDWIGRHLGDEDLGPATIAAANGLSVRYLHRLFQGSGVSVSGYVRSLRLRRIREDLANPIHQHHTIAAIGARWGIPDAAHLCRLFRAEFMVTPSEARRRTREPAPVA
jgi:AraC-like DNA-binding protein